MFRGRALLSFFAAKLSNATNVRRRELVVSGPVSHGAAVLGFRLAVPPDGAASKSLGTSPSLVVGVGSMQCVFDLPPTMQQAPTVAPTKPESCGKSFHQRDLSFLSAEDRPSNAPVDWTTPGLRTEWLTRVLGGVCANWEALAAEA